MASAVPELPVLARDQAFETLYRRYVKDVYHYALALLRNPADAEDVMQTTFLNAYRAYQRGIEIEKPHNWLIKIAHNVARTRYARASRRVKEVPLEDHVEQLAVPEADRPDVTGVLRALGRLPFNQRAALVMRELEGRSYAEIADTIGVSVSAVETLIFRARKSLRLKASALRALAAFPLPSSLTQLFEGGGVVAGGGAVVGTGFLVKAAVALVAGAVATGIGGDHSGTTAAAAEAMPKVEVAESWHRADGFMVRPVRAVTVKGAQITGENRVRDGSATTVAGTKRAARLAVAGRPRLARPGAGSAAPENSTEAVLPSLSGQVAEVVSTVEKAAVEVPAALPLQAPSLPPLPVEVPKVPGRTPLP
ncbi:MAG: RNA polymerase sigma factor [Actinomycetota bacterium]|nr:RNA polymerase sigma factor [Actinomycetota bacterium]